MSQEPTGLNDLSLLNAAFVARLWEDYRADPQSVSDSWQAYFRDFENNGERPASAESSEGPARPSAPAATEAAVLQDRVDQLIRAYRVRGHTMARIDPLNLPRPAHPELAPEYYGLGEADMDRQVSSRTIAGPPLRTLRDLLSRMRNTYCRSIGVQFMHIDDLDIRHWIQERMEGAEGRLELTREEQLRILSALTRAVVFEESLQKKFVGAKTFSLEGCETLIPLLESAIERASEQGVREIVIGMAHRGRLNVQANLMGKCAADIFHEFEDRDPATRLGAGDVKYHLGYSTDWTSPSGRQVHLSLCFNPSHLEFINPVATGRMRAKQDRVGDVERRRGMALLLHGDAAMAGEGIVQETLNLSELPGYMVGGTLHVVINNQIGFTTPPQEGRSSLYATDVAKMLQIPIFHVNGEDPEAVAFVVNVAMDFRQTFRKDVVIDMYGYRRHGHNELDEPSFTQPVMYRAVRERQGVREGYLGHLLQLGKLSAEEAEDVAVRFRESLSEALALARSEEYQPPDLEPRGIWAGYRGGPEAQVDDVDTSVDRKRLTDLLRRLNNVPDGFQRHPMLDRFVKKREDMAAGKIPLDWSAAEVLALATLAMDGVPIRLTGQDSARGTFGHRHAILYDHETGEAYVPLRNLAEKQAPVEVYNSPLSEAAVLGFDYGYSLDYPEALVLWEAQFGDFANAAQVIIDQFLVSAEDKWRRLSGIVLLLPHGYDGQGPEHSSARLERWLTLAAEDNIQVVQPSTPAQMFHLLRRQVLRSWRKPLIVLTPKNLLRHPAAVSTLDDLSDGGFHRIIPDDKCPPKKGQRILLCSGKIYFDLVAKRDALKRDDVAIVRIEQFYPWRNEFLEETLEGFAQGTPALWVQEEPENMGAWPFLSRLFKGNLLGRFPFSGIHRPASASPATGSSAAHKQEQKELIDAAFS
ncbi:MAG TPA: 2-oxoglutarate dehydrogenase E1 component [Phycisphaerae bacterium]|nr:2-oxoglutarate dehydrogenase E1 component [Phycisphaerae bacterium]